MELCRRALERVDLKDVESEKTFLGPIQEGVPQHWRHKYPKAQPRHASAESRPAWTSQLRAVIEHILYLDSQFVPQENGCVCTCFDSVMSCHVPFSS